MESGRSKYLPIAAWGLALLVSGLAVIVWGQNSGWQLLPISNYRLFPLLGLTAFSLMWTHYVIGTLREMSGVKPESLTNYYRYTGYAVLLLIVLHPGLLVYQLFRDGAGLPPGSYYNYVGPGLKWVVTLGFISLLIFLAFELHRLYSDRKWWRYVADASDLAMLAVLYHGFQLGSDIQTSWFKSFWYFYAAILGIVLIRKYYLRLVKK